MRVPNDIARCDGIDSNKECAACIRRTAPRDGRVWMIVTPAFNSFGKCPMRVGEEISRYDQFDSCAKDAYKLADAMLKARK